ncbi:MAG: acyl-CoA dehydrogenase family protein [SAR324 cluster bacterium]|jgi:acyl-CoA dehydrogenase|nr:acyl-CoA dehydrogenase family protein [SAR324 cluster bacterium]MDP7047536.1 acyl-CoA dehydrogenase family protein [SAR324 cluster bacterium]MEC7886815.1 acyl-CoA dehydrogenase family protein [SAR324 cluster bacterium]MEC9460064.1 acyl-CoA dehydrogenase family protein [SAR324 cluster bacterium]MED5434368.1 acyl-CoA dehydrogenase family protein [SAR324 cluster bacterium]
MSDRSFLNSPFFEDEHRVLALELEKWAKTELTDYAITPANVDLACQELVLKLADGGWLDYCVANKYGGKNPSLDVRSLCLIRETLARFSGLADFAFAMQGLGSGTISLFGSAELKQKYLPDVRSGNKIAAFALTEPDAGSDAAALTTTAEQVDTSFVLNGEKTLISNGGIADYYTVFAKTGEAPGTRGISAFVVDADTAGLEINERIEVIAAHPLARIRFNQCRIPKTQQIGVGGEGFKMAMATLDIFRSTVGAAALGFARHAMHEALNRTKSRQMFGAPMSKLQMIKAKLGEMSLDIDASSLLIYRAAWTKDKGAERITKEAAMAKLFATEAAQRVIDEAVQIFGGSGVVSGVPVEQLYREIRALRIYEGASEVQKLIIAAQTLKENN